MNAFYESSRLHIDKELYKEVKKLIEAKKQAFFDKNSQKCWQTKGIITVVSSFNAIDNSKSLKYDIKTMPKIFQKFFSNLA